MPEAELTLYHWEPNGASLRVLAALEEKELVYDCRFLDVSGRENHGAGFTELNPSGELPVLWAEGEALTEASYIGEYIDEAYPEVPLLPADSHGRWVARGWQKFVDDYLAGAISDLAWAALGDRSAAAAGAESAPTVERKAVWRQHSEPFSEDRLTKAREYVAQAVEKIGEAMARGPWLAGDSFGLADIAVLGYAGYLPRILPDALDAPARDWLDRCLARESVKAALAKGRGGDPFALVAPGPEQTRWG